MLQSVPGVKAPGAQSLDVQPSRATLPPASDQVPMRPLTAALLLSLASTAALAENAKWRAAGRHVLVIYRNDDADRRGRKTQNSLRAAEYYAARRNVPKENLLGLTLALPKGQRHWSYPAFYERILKPVAAKLASKTADGKPFSDRICYILTVPGVPMYLNTGHSQPKDAKKRDWALRTSRRSLDQWLMSVDANLKAGVDEPKKTPGVVAGRPLGGSFGHTIIPLFGYYRAAARAKHFRELRATRRRAFNFYLVTRLGNSLRSARDMLDGALYAERYLRLPGPGEQAAMRPTIWLDQKYRFASDQVAAMARTIPVVRGVAGSPFAEGKGLRRVWPLVIDRHEAEIGAGKAAGHKPTVFAKIAKDGVKGNTVTLEPARKLGRQGKDAPPALYFSPGWPVTNGKAAAKIVAVNLQANALTLDSAKGFAPGDTVTWTWPGTFPAGDCFLFYGFYGLGRYEDVFKFLPGALGVHVDSSCMTWARGAMNRGIAATFGVTTEPLSAGIPYGDQVLLALAAGYDWAEAVYGSVRFGQRWAGVAFGDPLYAPFRSLQKKDTTKPVLGPVRVTTAGRATVLSVALAGKTPDEVADVALFKLEYGPGKAYRTTVEFFHWPEPEKSRGVKGRRFGYSRHATWTLPDAAKGAAIHYRITARDPAGNETVSKDATLKP